MRYFTSAIHLGHNNIVQKYRTEISSVQEHDQLFFDQLYALGKRDILVIIGDFLFDCENYDQYIEKISRAKCRIQLVFGNHDSLKLLKCEKIEIQLPLYSYKNIWISHCPIHPSEMRGRLGNIHGHLHKCKIPDNRYFNVNFDVNDYKFVSNDTILNYFKNRKETLWTRIISKLKLSCQKKS
jgi:calcineurin-like phosphoesterase family protein